MTDNDAWVLQVSPKLPDGTLVNIRGKDAFQFTDALQLAEEKAGEISRVVALLQGGTTLAHAGVTGQVVQAAAPALPNQQPQPAAPPAPAPVAAPAAVPAGTPAPQCIHGARQYKANKPGAARTWSAWMCPTPQNTPGQCNPIDAVSGQEWKK